MLDVQRECINLNLSELIENTRCHELFIAKLQQKEILSDTDKCQLLAENNQQARTSLLYDILQTRTNGFAGLQEALKETNQTVAYEILTPNHSFVERIIVANELEKRQGGITLLRGKFFKRKVIVKKINLDYNGFTIEDIVREVEIWKQQDWQQNLIRYFTMEIRDKVIFLAMEAFDKKLCDWVLDKGDIEISPKEIMRQTGEGLKHLHDNDIVHGSIQPDNIFLVCFGKGNISVKISDFSLSRIINQDKEHIKKFDNLLSKWTAPEILENSDGGYQFTLASDVFSLGCVFYFVVSCGEHPFGKRHHEILKNVVDNIFQINRLTLDPDYLGDLWVVLSMLCAEPSLRPTMRMILSTPMFWTKHTSLRFIMDIGDSLVHQKYDLLFKEIEQLKHIKFENWSTRICAAVKPHLQKSQPSLAGLLMNIKYFSSIYADLPLDVKTAMGGYPGNFLNYWFHKFPHLQGVLWVNLYKADFLSEYYFENHEFNLNIFAVTAFKAYNYIKTLKSLN